MADSKISNLTAASAFDGTELFPVVQSGTTKKGIIKDLYAPITVDFLTLTQLTVDHAVIEGQVYKYVDTTYLPATIDHILLTGSGTQTYNNIGQAYVTAIGKYVQCDYDIASNKVGGSVVIWAGTLNQNSVNDPTIDHESINLLPSSPTFIYASDGLYLVTLPISILEPSNFIPYSITLSNDIVLYTFYNSSKELFIATDVILSGGVNDVLHKTYIEIKINL